MADQRLHQFNTGVQIMYESCETSYWFLFEQIRNCADGWSKLQLPAVDEDEHPDPHNDTTIAQTTIPEFVAQNILMAEEKMRDYRALYDKIEEVVKTYGVSIQFVGSLLHETALTGSDLDIIVVPQQGVQYDLLQNLLPVLQQGRIRHALNINVVLIIEKDGIQLSCCKLVEKLNCKLEIILINVASFLNFESDKFVVLLPPSSVLDQLYKSFSMFKSASTITFVLFSPEQREMMQDSDKICDPSLSSSSLIPVSTPAIDSQPDSPLS